MLLARKLFKFGAQAKQYQSVPLPLAALPLALLHVVIMPKRSMSLPRACHVSVCLCSFKLELS